MTRWGLSAMADCIVEGPTNLLGDTESGDTFSRDDTVYGLSFTPSTDIIVTHVSRLFGRGSCHLGRENGAAGPG